MTNQSIKNIFEDQVNIIKDSDEVTTIQIRDKEGVERGTMTFYEILPGITLTYNDFYMDEIKSTFTTQRDVFCVDHCREGRIEQEIKPGIFRYVGPGDLRLDNRKNHATNFYFPLAVYHGITVMFESQLADESIKSLIYDFPVSILQLRERYCEKEPYTYLRNEGYVEHIFKEMYQVPQKARKHYMIVKILELLLCLWELESTDDTEIASYYTKNQTDKVKAICETITKDFQKKYTLEELAKQFQISPTGMKNTFKGIYGKSIHLWLTEKRMERACILLREGKMSVTEIANEVGYESPSKFSAAFKKIMNLTPIEFRNGQSQKLKEKKL